MSLAEPNYILQFEIRYPVPAELLVFILEKGCKHFFSPVSSAIKGIAKFDSNFQLKDLFFFFVKSAKVLLDLAASCHGLVRLAVHGTQEISQKGFTKLLKCIIQSSETLEVLTINHRKLKYEELKLIVTLCVNLTDLNIRGTRISQKSVNFLCRNITTKLRKLDISWQPMFGDDQLEVLVTRCELSELCITETSVSNNSVSLIVQKMPRCLAKFEAENNTFSFSNLLKIASLQKLKVLCVWNLPTNAKEEILKKVPHLSFSNRKKECEKPSDTKCLLCDHLNIASPYQSCVLNVFGWEIKDKLRQYL